MEFKHISVLFSESIDALNVKDGGVYADATLGGGGHSLGILSKSKSSNVIGIDRDAEAVKAAAERLRPFKDRFTAVNGNFSEAKSILSDLGVTSLDGVIMDLGVSSYQLDNAERGFSYMKDAPLDMRMNRSDKKTAYDVVNSYSEDYLAQIFWEYGEDKWSKRVAEFICRERQKKPIETTYELVDVIKAAIPKGARSDGGHPAKRFFQAIRIEVNDELNILAGAVNDFTSLLKAGGRIAVITFHSFEDRIVKQTLRSLEKGCVCPKEFPICVCGRKPEIKMISKKPVLPSQDEIEQNPRSKSAKLRIAEKL